MPKRRSVVLGLGAMAFGSGAVSMSGAFSTDFASPQGDLRVIADAGLRVRSARDANGNPIVASNVTAAELDVSSSSNFDIQDTGSLSTDFSTFFSNTVEPLITSPGQPEAAALEINEGVNDELGIRSAFSNRLNGEVSPLLEISNNTGSTQTIRISYATNDGTNLDQIDSTGQNGYGADVNAVEDTSGEYASSGANELSRQEVQGIYQFRTDDTSNPRNTIGSTQLKLLSPDPTFDGSTSPADEGANTHDLASGDTMFVKMDFNTDAADLDGDSSNENLTGIINSAAGAGGNVFADNSNLDLLNTIYVTAN